MIPEDIDLDQIMEDLQTDNISVSQAPSKQDHDNIGYYRWVTQESVDKNLGTLKIVAVDSTYLGNDLRDVSQYIYDNLDPKVDTVIVQGTNQAGVTSDRFSRAQIISAEGELDFNTGSPGAYKFLEMIEDQGVPNWSLVYGLIAVVIITVIALSITVTRHLINKKYES